MNIKTKYNIGDKLFWIEERGGIYKINYNSITSIKVGGKIWEKYEISYTTRAGRDLFTDFKEAKKEAIIRQKEFNKRALEIIDEYTEPLGVN